MKALIISLCLLSSSALAGPVARGCREAIGVNVEMVEAYLSQVNDALAGGSLAGSRTQRQIVCSALGRIGGLIEFRSRLFSSRCAEVIERVNHESHEQLFRQLASLERSSCLGASGDLNQAETHAVQELVDALGLQDAVDRR